MVLHLGGEIALRIRSRLDGAMQPGKRSVACNVCKNKKPADHW